MDHQILLGDMVVDVVLKNIKNIHLSVYPPMGHVRISAPLRMELEVIRLYVISKLDWIKQQQRKLREQRRETAREYLERESFYVWGHRYLLKIVHKDAPPQVELSHSQMILHIRPDTAFERREEVVEEWYRNQVRLAVPKLLQKWEPLIGVKCEGIVVRRMKTKWGSASVGPKTIRLNTELAKKPSECLEYIAVHELVHLLEPTHNRRFIELMDHFLPTWRFHRETLNRLPVRHERWGY